MATVLDRCGTGPGSFGATSRIPGVKTENTAKKRRKKHQKWARYSHLKRVRVADLFLMDRYIDWPFAPSVMPMLADYVDEAAALGMHVKMYFTLGQITNHMTELFALKSLGDEILLENASALPPAQTGIVGDSLAMGDGRVQVRGMGNGLVGVSGAAAAALFCRVLSRVSGSCWAERVAGGAHGDGVSWRLVHTEPR